jgi:hypothetical protein
MSALPPKADLCSANRHVCFGPEADINSYNFTLQLIEIKAALAKRIDE